MKDTLYFCMRLTENEHYIVADDIAKFLENTNARLVYYRVLKDGHVPMIREVKIEGFQASLDHFKRWFMTNPTRATAMSHHIVKNPHKVDHELDL